MGLLRRDGGTDGGGGLRPGARGGALRHSGDGTAPPSPLLELRERGHRRRGLLLPRRRWREPPPRRPLPRPRRRRLRSPPPPPPSIRHRRGEARMAEKEEKKWRISPFSWAFSLSVSVHSGKPVRTELDVNGGAFQAGRVNLPLFGLQRPAGPLQLRSSSGQRRS